MAKKGDDSWVGLVVGLVIAVALVSAVNGDPLTGAAQPESSAPTPTPTARTVTVRPASVTSAREQTNIPGGALFGCSGTVISEKTAGRGASAVNLKVFYADSAGGRNCAVASKVGSAARRSGPIQITLRFADSSANTWPTLAEHRSIAAASRSGAVYLDGTDGRCIRAEARFTPDDGSKTVTVSSGRTGCR
jgi:hypothetical protein